MGTGVQYNIVAVKRGCADCPKAHLVARIEFDCVLIRNGSFSVALALHPHDPSRPEWIVSGQGAPKLPVDCLRFSQVPRILLCWTAHQGLRRFNCAFRFNRPSLTQCEDVRHQPVESVSLCRPVHEVEKCPALTDIRLKQHLTSCAASRRDRFATRGGRVRAGVGESRSLRPQSDSWRPSFVSAFQALGAGITCQGLRIRSSIPAVRLQVHPPAEPHRQVVREPARHRSNAV